MAQLLYRKTAAGVAEVRERKAGLDGRSRALLILCNGQMNTAQLSAHLNAPVDGLLKSLCEQGLLEAVPVAARVAETAARAAAQPATPLARSGGLFSRVAALAGRDAASGASSSSKRPPSTQWPASSQSTLPPPLPSATLDWSPEAHDAVMRRAWALLEPLFGPGTAERLEPAQRATNAADLRRALEELRDIMSVYQGRKKAALLIQRIEQG